MSTYRSTPAYSLWPPFFIFSGSRPGSGKSQLMEEALNAANTFYNGLAASPKYTDVMIDIEALANTPDSAPAEIGIVFFDRNDSKKQFLSYRYRPSPMSAILLGFNVTADTLKWWHDKAMHVDLYQGEPLTDVLDEMARDIDRHAQKGCRVWSRGNSYDLAILKLAYQRTGKPLPWHFGNERDVRTWLEGCQFKSPRKNDHDALEDAINQALDVVEATIAIPDSNVRHGSENPCQPLPTLA